MDHGVKVFMYKCSRKALHGGHAKGGVCEILVIILQSRFNNVEVTMGKGIKSCPSHVFATEKDMLEAKMMLYYRVICHVSR